MSRRQSIVYAFIDSQNLNLGVQSQGWRLDFKKFRLYLKNKYGVARAYLFIGQMTGNQELYDYLRQSGYELIFKPTTEYKVDGKVTVKGNVDAELVLYAAAKVYNDYDRAIIVSGDGDFRCLVDYLYENKKLLTILTPNHRFSRLLRSYSKIIVPISRLRLSLEFKKHQPTRSVETLGGAGDVSRSSGRCKTLGLPRNGDTSTVTKKSPKVKMEVKGGQKLVKSAKIQSRKVCN